MSLIDRVLRRPEFAADPPVLVDVGASGGIHRDWAKLAPYSVCVAFEPDERERGVVERANAGYRKLTVYRAVLTDRDQDAAEFFLTRSPYCSSTLAPLPERLAPWSFHPLFEVTGTARFPAVTIERVLAEQNLARVDWFKTDSQGTDLRLFRSLGEARMERALIAQFEPGILAAYQGEDTLADLLAFMRERGFWLSELHVRGARRLSARAQRALGGSGDDRAVKVSPGWAEATYLNTLEGEWSVRDRLLAWVVATLRRQHGFALEVALGGGEASKDSIFETLRGASANAIARAAWTLPALAFFRRSRAFLEGRGWV